MDYNLVMATPFGLPAGTSSIRKALNDLIKEHNLPPVVFHSLRHTSVTYKLKLNDGARILLPLQVRMKCKKQKRTLIRKQNPWYN